MELEIGMLKRKRTFEEVRCSNLCNHTLADSSH